MPATTITPAEARRRLDALVGCNEVGTEAERRELYRVLDAADEVRETDPVKMLGMADALERWAAAHEAKGDYWSAAEDLKMAERYRRNARVVQAAMFSRAA